MTGVQTCALPICIAFHVSGESWTFSDISFNKYEAPSAGVIEEYVVEGVDVTFDKKSIGAGESVILTLTGGSSYLLSVNGKEISVNGNTYEIAYDDYASVMLNPQITVSVHAFTDTEVSGTSNTRVTGKLTISIRRLWAKKKFWVMRATKPRVIQS